MSVRALLAVPAVAAVLAGCTDSSTPTPTQSPTPERPGTTSTAQSAPSPADVARAEAGRLLVLVTPPSGAVRAEHSPVSAEDDPPQSTATDDIAQLTRWWTVPRPPDRVYAAFNRQGLPTLQQQGSGSATAGGTTTLRYLMFTTSPKPGLDSETVLVTVAPDDHGGTALRVDAQVVWRPARSSAETIPSDIDRIQVAAYVVSPQHRLLAQRTLTGDRARRLATVINRLPTAARAVHSCMADNGYTLRVVAGSLRFLQIVACSDVTVARDGHPLPSLAGAGFTHAVATTLGLPDHLVPRWGLTPHARRSPVPGR